MQGHWDEQPRRRRKRAEEHDRSTAADEVSGDENFNKA
jgi:hypothetical protein